MFNAVKVNSQLRNSNMLQWYREENKDYVLNGYWLMKVNLKDEKNRKILGLLVELFGSIPGEKKGLKRLRKVGGFGISEILTKPDWFTFIEEEENTTRLIDTGLTLESNPTNKVRIFVGSDYIYLRSNYLEMIKNNGLNIKGSGDLHPAYFTKEDDLLMIMPVGMCEDSEHLKVLENKKDPKEL